MTPKEKAEEILGRFTEVKYKGKVALLSWSAIKQCALICVDEITKALENEMEKSGIAFELTEDCYYWLKVKAEINK
jgi:hypothetical protein